MASVRAATPWLLLAIIVGGALVWGWFDVDGTDAKSGLANRFKSLRGEDGRRSTSKLTAFVWVVAVAAAAAFLLSKVALQSDVTLKSTGLQDLNEQYLVLMGAPLFGLMASKGIVQAKVRTGSLQKPPPAVAGYTEGGFALDDKGNVDLLDLQYLLFNAVLLAYFALMVLVRTMIPDLPPTLVGLSGVAAAAYVAGKVVAANPPVISVATHALLNAHDIVIVRGTNLLKPAPGADLVPYVSVTGLAVTNVVDWNDAGTIIRAQLTGQPGQGSRVSITTGAGASVDHDIT
jgi:hypothetical protein